MSTLASTSLSPDEDAKLAWALEAAEVAAAARQKAMRDGLDSTEEARAAKTAEAAAAAQASVDAATAEAATAAALAKVEAAKAAEVEAASFAAQAEAAAACASSKAAEQAAAAAAAEAAAKDAERAAKLAEVTATKVAEAAAARKQAEEEAKREHFRHAEVELPLLLLRRPHTLTAPTHCAGRVMCAQVRPRRRRQSQLRQRRRLRQKWQRHRFLRSLTVHDTPVGFLPDRLCTHLCFRRLSLVRVCVPRRELQSTRLLRRQRGPRATRSEFTSALCGSFQLEKYPSPRPRRVASARCFGSFGAPSARVSSRRIIARRVCVCKGCRA